MISLPNSTSILASGKAGTLAVTVLAADRVTVLVARGFGTLTEIGTTAVYWGPPLVVDAAAAGFLRYDTDGNASTIGVVVDLQPFVGAAAAVWDAAPSGTPLADIAAVVWDAAPAGTPLADIAEAISGAISGDAAGGVSAATIATAVWDAAPAGTPLATIAQAVRDVDIASPAPGTLAAAVAAVKLRTDNLPASWAR